MVKPNDLVHVEQTRYEIEQFHVRRRLDKKFVKDYATFKAQFDRLTDTMTIEMELLLAGRVLQEKTISWPTTWWDHFKLEGVPHWIKRRRWFWRFIKPVHWSKQTMRAMDMHPEIRPNPEDQRRGFVIIHTCEGVPSWKG